MNHDPSELAACKAKVAEAEAACQEANDAKWAAEDALEGAEGTLAYVKEQDTAPELEARCKALKDAAEAKDIAAKLTALAANIAYLELHKEIVLKFMAPCPNCGSEDANAFYMHGLCEPCYEGHMDAAAEAHMGC